MRKSLVAALAAPTVLVMATVAFAQNPAPTIDVKATISPTKAGTKKKPKSEKISLQIDNSRESKTSASKIEISFPKTLKLSTKGLKTCSVAKLDSQGKASCPRGSCAGLSWAPPPTALWRGCAGRATVIARNSSARSDASRPRMNACGSR